MSPISVAGHSGCVFVENLLKRGGRDCCRTAEDATTRQFVPSRTKPRILNQCTFCLAA